MHGNSFTAKIDEIIMKFNESTSDISEELKKLKETAMFLDCIDRASNITLEELMCILMDEKGRILNEDLNNISLKLFNKDIDCIPIVDLLTCLYYYDMEDYNLPSGNVIALPSYYDKNSMIFNLRCNEAVVYSIIYNTLDDKFKEENAEIDYDAITKLSASIANDFCKFKKKFLELWNILGPLLCSKFGIDPKSIVGEVINYTDWFVTKDDLLFANALCMICDEDDEEEMESRMNAFTNLLYEYRRKYPYFYEYYIRVYAEDNIGHYNISTNNWSDECLLIKFLDLNTSTKFEDDRDATFSNMIKSLNRLIPYMAIEDALKLVAMAYIVTNPGLTLEEAIEESKKNLPNKKPE